MLVFLPPSEEYLPALAAYRRICREAGDDMDGSAGLGSFTALSDWLNRVRLLESPVYGMSRLLFAACAERFLDKDE